MLNSMFSYDESFSGNTKYSLNSVQSVIMKLNCGSVVSYCIVSEVTIFFRIELLFFVKEA